MSSPARFGVAINVEYITATSTSYRPPCWPPPRDWVCVEDKFGKAISTWGDSIWRLDPWARKPMTLNFGDGARIAQTTAIDRDNADILRLLVTWRGWGPNGARNAATLKNFFTSMRAIVALCSREGILASDLMHFSLVREKLPQVIAPSIFAAVISELQRVLDARKDLGFILLDQNGLRQLVAAKPVHSTPRPGSSVYRSRGL